MVFAGSGGQGILTVGTLLSEIACSKGYQATWLPQYGSAMRGGTANCTVKFDEEIVYNPSQEEPDILLAMNFPSLKRFGPIVKNGGTIVVNSDVITEEELETVREDIKLVRVPATKIAQELNHAMGANVVMAGAISNLSGEISMEEGINGMNEMFRRRGRERFEEANTKAFETGYKYVEE